MRTIIIAEAGVNHNGNIENAKKLIKLLVKWQITLNYQKIRGGRPYYTSLHGKKYLI